MSKRSKRRRSNAGRPPMTDAEKAKVKEARGTPNARVVARQDAFRLFRGDGAIGHEMTCAGRLMIVGAFDGLDADPETVLSALLDYSRCYWRNYGGGPKVADHSRVGHSPPNAGPWDDPNGERFEERDTALRSAGHAARSAVHTITVDRHWFPDENADWADRIINSRFLAKRDQFVNGGRAVPVALEISGELASDSDWAMLEIARAGAIALVGEKRKLAA